jgi:hypothetical protein
MSSYALIKHAPHLTQLLAGHDVQKVQAVQVVPIRTKSIKKKSHRGGAEGAE